MSFQQGLSGLNASSKNLEVIGNNIANANTFGSKTARAEFSDVYAAALNGAGTNVVGIGTTLTAVAQQFTQGSITTTNNPVDLAINGSGFFQVTDGVNPVAYTRNGQFKVNRDGFIVNNAQKQLMGYAANALGVIQPGQAVPLQLPTGGVSPAPTTTMKLEMNLDARLPVTKPAAPPAISFADASTYNNATSLTTYDAKGQQVALTYYFQKDSADTWNVFATADGVTVAGSAAAPAAVGQIKFDPATGLSPTTVPSPLAFTIPANAKTGTLAIPITRVDISKSTQFGAGYGVTNLTQDGFSAGQLTAISIESDGIVMAKYSNGQQRQAGQVEIATFRNPQGLKPAGGNAWSRSYASGEPIVGVPGSGNLGVLQAGALEDSNVDLTGELVSMITAQRVYQANAQTIKAQDQVMQTLVNLR